MQGLVTILFWATPYLVLGGIGYFLMRTLRSDARRECPKCRGTRQVTRFDPKENKLRTIDCFACRKTGEVRRYKTFKYTRYSPCGTCDGTGYVRAVKGSVYPDGSTQPGGKARRRRCGRCKKGWIIEKKVVEPRDIVPIDRWRPEPDERSAEGSSGRSSE